jgi:peptide deformylase
MSILKVARLGHPILRQVAEPIEPRTIIGPEIQRLIGDMLETMAEYNGVGLAAPQVHVSKRLLLAGGVTDEEGNPRIQILINPEVRPTTEQKLGMFEGCLSVPGMRGYVERPAGIDVKAYNEKGQRVAFHLDGFPAVVMQHEVDHLDGVLYVDRLADTRLFGFEDETERFLTPASGDDERDDDANGAVDAGAHATMEGEAGDARRRS